jgi:hypothetical protein
MTAVAELRPRASVLAQKVLGVDLSLTHTAVALGDYSAAWAKTFPTKSLGEDVHARMARCALVVEPVVAVARQHAAELALIVFEAYPYAGGRFAGKAYDRGELGGILRWEMRGLGVPIVEAFPNTLKAFAADYGRADKNEVREALGARYHVAITDDNQADAFACMALGQCVLGRWVASSTKQDDVVRSCRRKWGIGP